MYLVLSVAFIPRCIVKAIQDDISSKTIRLSLHDPYIVNVTAIIVFSANMDSFILSFKDKFI